MAQLHLSNFVSSLETPYSPRWWTVEYPNELCVPNTVFLDGIVSLPANAVKRDEVSIGCEKGCDVCIELLSDVTIMRILYVHEWVWFGSSG